MQITKAMKMVSAAKLNKAQEAITAMRPYADKLTELLQNLSASSDGANSPYALEREVENVLIVAVSSNRGLAGAFNTNIVKRVNRLVEETYLGKTIDIVALGKKAGDVLAKNHSVILSNTEIFDDLSFDKVADIAQNMMDSYVDESYDKIVFVYNSFINAGTQEVKAEQFLPIVPKQADDKKSETVDYIFEPEKEKIIQDLIPKSLKMQLFKALRDSVASEHGARMTAMHKATDNATDLRDNLSLQYNKARQAAITNEILEIVGGAEALNG